MLTELIALAAAVFTVLLVYVLHVVVVNYMAIENFRKKSPQIPIVPNRNVFSNHYGLLYGFEVFKKYSEFHEKLGPTYAAFLNDQPHIHTKDLDFLNRIVLEDPNAHINRSNPLVPLREFKRDNIAFLFDEQWKRVRRVYASALSAHKIKSANVQAEFVSVLERFLNALEWRINEGGSKLDINLDDLCSRWSFDLTFTCLFKQPNFIDYKSLEDNWVCMIHKNANLLKDTAIAHIMAFPIFHKYLNWLANFHSYGKARALLASVIKKQASTSRNARREFIDELKMKGNMVEKFAEHDEYTMKNGIIFRRNILDLVTDKYHDRTLTESEYLDSTMFLNLAAGKTTAEAATSVIFHLAKHLEIQERLRTAIMKEGINSEYLNWVIHESIRLVPPVNGFARILAHDMHTSDGRLVPRGSTVTAIAQVIHHDSERWGDDAEDFRPERWADAKNFHKCQFLGFGLGKRSCPGNKFALEGIKMLLDALLRRFKFEESAYSEELNVLRAPLHMMLIFERPTYVKISRLESRGTVTDCLITS